MLFQDCPVGLDDGVAATGGGAPVENFVPPAVVDGLLGVLAPVEKVGLLVVGLALGVAGVVLAVFGAVDPVEKDGAAGLGVDPVENDGLLLGVAEGLLLGVAEGRELGAIDGLLLGVEEGRELGVDDLELLDDREPPLLRLPPPLPPFPACEISGQHNVSKSAKTSNRFIFCSCSGPVLPTKTQETASRITTVPTPKRKRCFFGSRPLRASLFKGFLGDLDLFAVD